MTGKPPDPTRRPPAGNLRQELIRQRQAADRQRPAPPARGCGGCRGRAIKR